VLPLQEYGRRAVLGTPCVAPADSEGSRLVRACTHAPACGIPLHFRCVKRTVLPCRTGPGTAAALVAMSGSSGGLTIPRLRNHCRTAVSVANEEHKVQRTRRSAPRGQWPGRDQRWRLTVTGLPFTATWFGRTGRRSLRRGRISGWCRRRRAGSLKTGTTTASARSAPTFVRAPSASLRSLRGGSRILSFPRARFRVARTPLAQLSVSDASSVVSSTSSGTVRRRTSAPRSAYDATQLLTLGHASHWACMLQDPQDGVVNQSDEDEWYSTCFVGNRTWRAVPHTQAGERPLTVTLAASVAPVPVPASARPLHDVGPARQPVRYVDDARVRGRPERAAQLLLPRHHLAQDGAACT